jgi:glucosyl-dolichyl phosphate glucuronosyltransferase
MMISKSGIEFSICTYNRSAFLKECVASLLKQMIPGRTMVTVIDNNSTDDTREWVLQKLNEYPGLRYIHEPVQGLSQARNTAWRNAEFEWVFYLDDDCLPPDGFVTAALHLIDQHKEFDAFGGPIESVFIKDPPDWLPAGFGNFSMPFDVVTLIGKGFIRGGCFLIRKSVIEQLGGFNPDLGVKGNTLRYGEELELQLRMHKEGYKIAYAPSLRIGHYVRAGKINVRWLLRSEYARRRDKVQFDSISLPLASLHLCRILLGRVLWTPVHVYQLIASEPHSVRRMMYDILKPLAYATGEWVGTIQRITRKR